MNRHGYFTGAAIAVATVALAVYTGMVYERMTAPEPCIANLSTVSYPMFEFEQQMLDQIVDYSPDSDLYRGGIKTSEELAERLVAMSQDSDWPSSIYTNTRTGNRFYVPGLCRVGSVDVFGDPVLVRR